MQAIDPLVEIGNGQLAAAILTDNGRSNALPHLRFGIRRFVQAAIGMAVHVNEAGRQHLACGVDHPFARLCRQTRTNFSDDIAGDANVDAARRAAGAVDHLGIANQ